jgi:hypothetical protein
MSPKQLISFNTTPNIYPLSASCLIHNTLLAAVGLRWLVDIYKICIPLEKLYHNTTAVRIWYEDYVSSLKEYVVIPIVR